MDDAIDEREIAAWTEMAEHFLDTETRQGIPATALACVRAGYTVEEARAIWRLEVEPTLAWNMLSVAGEWSGWDPDWLLEQQRLRRKHRPRGPRGRLGRLRDRIRIELNSGVRSSVEHCMGVLLAAAPDERQALADDLGLLARHYFDFGPSDLTAESAARIERLSALAPLAFDAFASATAKDERAAYCARMTSALGAALATHASEARP